MNVLTTYKVFLVKTLKEKKYYWARNAFFLLFPLFFIIIYLFSGSSSSDNNGINHIRPYQQPNTGVILH
jgi:hypothetical protein